MHEENSGITEMPIGFSTIKPVDIRQSCPTNHVIKIVNGWIWNKYGQTKRERYNKSFYRNDNHPNMVEKDIITYSTQRMPKLNRKTLY